METRRPLKEQEEFYAYLEGKHCAIDDMSANDNSWLSVFMFYAFNKNAQNNFRKGYSDEICKISSGYRAGITRG